ncbi:MAG TPA: PBP1A family penicillin-binding protein [Thermoanaerobaculia bacterium]
MSRRRAFDRNKLLAVLATPFAIAALVASGYMAFMYHRMSRTLLSRQWKTPTRIYSATDPKGNPVVELWGSEWRASEPVHLDELPPHVPYAFLAAEDTRFRRHFGIDPIGMARALVANVRSGGVEQGGSTINQQLIKSLFLSQERTYRRKVVEVVLAVGLDLRMSKDEILEAYLNEVYLGHQRGRAIRGIEEGSRLFFNKPPAKLTPAEAALIAAIVPAPNRLTPEKRPTLARARRDRVLERMRRRDWITRAQYDAAVAERARFRAGALPEPPYGHYLAALRREMIERIGERRARRTGLEIVAEIDPRMQRGAEKAVDEGLRRLRRRYSWLREEGDSLEAAFVALSPRTGGIRALIGGADPRNTGLDRTVAMRRQPGSTFKTFAYLAAIESRKLTPATLLLDAPLRIEQEGDRVWEPRNYDERFRGRVTLREAFEKSLNVPAVRVTQRVGARSVVKAAHRAGIESEIPAVPAVPLGVAEVGVRELAAAYTIFPSLGTRVEPYIIAEIRGPEGEVLYHHETERKRATSPAAAYVVHSLLRGVVRRGTGNRLKRYGLAHAAGKTGTTSDYRDAWFVGYTPDVVAAVWVGFDRGRPLRLSSSEAALPIWGSMMSSFPTDRDDIDPPDGVVFRNVDPESGWIWAEGCPGPFREVFLEGTAPTRECPRGFFGRIIRSVLFDDEAFDEPAAITFDKFRQLANEVDQERQRVEGILGRLERIFGGGE